MSEASSNGTAMAREKGVGLLMWLQKSESDPTVFVSCGNIDFSTEPLWKIFQLQYFISVSRLQFNLRLFFFNVFSTKKKKTILTN